MAFKKCFMLFIFNNKKASKHFWWCNWAPRKSQGNKEKSNKYPMLLKLKNTWTKDYEPTWLSLNNIATWRNKGVSWMWFEKANEITDSHNKLYLMLGIIKLKWTISWIDCLFEVASYARYDVINGKTRFPDNLQRSR